MSETTNTPVTRGTLGLTGLTMNAMALIAPGAFLWLTFQMQSLYGAPMAGMSVWFGILFALLLCFATAISYSELAKLYPGPGSSYLYAEQAYAEMGGGAPSASFRINASQWSRNAAPYSARAKDHQRRT